MTFGSFPLSDLPLTPSQLAACERAGFSTAADILLAAPPELNRKLKNLTVQHIQNIVRIVAKAITPSAKRVVERSVMDEVQENGESSNSAIPLGVERWVGTGDVGLDEVLGGGIRTGVLTEISGESAAGKSHLCMALALSAQLPSYTPFPGGSIILTSERELPTDRLIQLAKSMLASQDTQHNHRTAIPTPSVKQLLDNIHTNKCTDVDALDHALSYSLPWVLEKNRLTGTDIRLIVLDSITALFRGGETTFSSTSAGLAHRSRLLCSIADKLKALAVEYDIAVVVINQVSDVFNKLPQPPPSTHSQTPGPSQMAPSQAQSAYEFSTQFYTDPGPEPPMLYSTQARWFSGQSQGYRKEASLGIVWANAINTRVMMSRTLRRKRITADSLENVVRKRQRVQEQTGAVDNTDGSGPSQDTHDEYWGIELESDTPTLIRRFHLVFSPFAPAATVDYIIAPSGIHTLTGSRRLMDLASILRKRKALEAIRKEMDDSGVAGLNGNGKGNEENGVDDEFGLEDSLEDIPAELWEGKFADQVAEAEAVGVVGDGS